MFRCAENQNTVRRENSPVFSLGKVKVFRYKPDMALGVPGG
jgi:hypothetical protein